MPPEKKLLVAIPCYTERVSTATMHAVIDVMIGAASQGWETKVLTINGDARIIQVRNRILADFFHGDFSDLFLLDDDIGCEPGAILRLLNHDVDLVAGAYRGRRDAEIYPIRWLKGDDGSQYLDEDGRTGLIEVAGAPTGFMRIRRACAERMIAHYNAGCYQTPQVDGGTVWRLFDDLPWEVGDYSEDYAFCQRWRDIGGQVWIDPAIKLQHVGVKTYEGSLKRWLLRAGPKDVVRHEVAA